MENANHSIILGPILVVGGWDDGGRTDTVELLSLTPGTESRILRKFPKKIQSAVGTTLGEFVFTVPGYFMYRDFESIKD